MMNLILKSANAKVGVGVKKTLLTISLIRF
ncbi:hypothetical protein BMS3Abin15_00833 [bacterium BMS3Abin15]|nr:hypothetical protein BMS3Abin15_00833 [bacterium BMS3Abin15]